MIQELFAGAGFVAPPDKKYSINNNNGGGGGGGLLLTPPPSSSSSSSTPTSTVVAATSSNSSENLRCPRCDSSNTKFCYYNNYNLTQPRHFCKTCRRYWTKGGALRNVPIGGGCRKNKNIGVSNSSAAKAASATPKMKAMVASELRRSSSSSSSVGIDHHDLPAGPILWGSPQNSHLLALLRASQSQNPNPNPSSMLMNGVSVKEERNYNMVSSTAVEPLMMNNNIPRTTLGYDGVGVGQIPQLDLCSSLWRTNNNNQDHQPAPAATSFLLSEQHQSSSNGIQQLYHKLRSTPNNNYATHNNSSPIFMPNMAASSSSSSSTSSLSTILESSSVSAAELGCWNNPTLPWLSDLPAATNGAYPN